MRRLLAHALLALTLTFVAIPNLSAKDSGGTVHVKGYVKKDGTYVAPHDRKAPKSGTTTSTSSSGSGTHKQPAIENASAVERNEHGRIVRSAAAKDAFMRQSGYPHGRPGYVVDHIVPLACGGADAPSNMQWQTVAAAKAKDAYERAGCR